ncbi:hypothetical protein J3A83DRAFT_3824684 [Scleroderma citrinum]
MDDLTKARAELTRLRDKEKELAKHLLDIRTEITAQEGKISTMIKLRPPAINTLPRKILLLIFDFVIRNDSDSVSLWKRKQKLAGVSRRWKDLILNSPILWSTIMVHEQDSAFTETCLKRSCETLLDIVVKGCNDLIDYTTLSSSLDIVMSCAHRWRSLHVDENEAFLGDFVVNKINHLDFPSLRRVTIPALRAVAYPNFLFSTHSPVLEHLHLGNNPAWQDFSPAITLKTLKSTFYHQRSASSPSFPYLIPVHTLTTLSLSGDIGKWTLRPNSIHFPHLDTLTLQVNRALHFLEAIAAPNLRHFVHSTFSQYDTPSVVFSNLSSKFASVRHLSVLHTLPGLDSDLDAERLCQAFPSVRHAELDSCSMLQLFAPRWPCGEFRADIWSDLVSLTLHKPCDSWFPTLDLLWGWLEERKRLNISPLRVKVMDIMEKGTSNVLHQYFYRRYYTSGDTYTLELDGSFPISPSVCISVGRDLSPKLVSPRIVLWLSFS